MNCQTCGTELDEFNATSFRHVHDDAKCVKALREQLTRSESRCKELEEVIRDIGECPACYDGEFESLDDDDNNVMVACEECGGTSLCSEARAALTTDEPARPPGYPNPGRDPESAP